MNYLILSVIVITLIFSYLDKRRVIAFCPICAGVVLAWVIGLVAVYTNMSWADPMFVGLLMAGSIGALAEKYGPQKGLMWKSTVVVVGFPAVYYLVTKNIFTGSILGALTALLVLSALINKNKKTIKQDMFDNCC